MYPILFKIYGIPIYSYGLMMAVAYLVCVILATHRARFVGIAPHHILDLSLYILISGIIGARLLYIFMNLPYYTKHPLEIFLLQKGGLSYYGGFVSALLIGIFVTKRRRLSLGKVADLVFLYLPLGHAIARIGCFLNGCCYGKPAEIVFAVRFPPYSLAACHFGLDHLLHPVQLYSILVNLVIFLLLGLVKKRFEGELIFDYMVLYGTGRFILEFFRADTPAVLWGLNTFHLISLGMVILGLALRGLVARKVTSV